VRRRPYAFAALVASFAVVSSWGQSAPPPLAGATGAPGAAESGSLAAIPEALLDQALSVSILASVGKPAEEPRWQARDVKYTIPGSSVSVRMVGSDAAIVITLTPYANSSGGLLLVVQGQVWYKDGDASLRYRTTVDTLSIAFGERVLFYPFGSHPDMGAPLRVELVMDKYAAPEGSP